MPLYPSFVRHRVFLEKMTSTRKSGFLGFPKESCAEKGTDAGFSPIERNTVHTFHSG